MVWKSGDCHGSWIEAAVSKKLVENGLQAVGVTRRPHKKEVKMPFYFYNCITFSLSKRRSTLKRVDGIFLNQNYQIKKSWFYLLA
jgi:hypothetical protein